MISLYYILVSGVARGEGDPARAAKLSLHLKIWKRGEDFGGEKFFRGG